MRYLKLYEEFIETDTLTKKEVELSDKTIDDVLKGKLFDKEDEKDKNIEDKNIFIDSKSVVHIKNWKQY